MNAALTMSWLVFFFWRAGANFQQNFKSVFCSRCLKDFPKNGSHLKKSSPNLGTWFLWPVFSTVLMVSPSLVAINVKSFSGCLPPVLLSPKYYVFNKKHWSWPGLGGSHSSVDNWRRFSVRFSMRIVMRITIEGSH